MKIGALISLLLLSIIGFSGIFFPHKIQQLAMHYYEKPHWGNKLRLYNIQIEKSKNMITKPSYITFLRVAGILSLLMGIVIFYFVFI